MFILITHKAIHPEVSGLELDYNEASIIPLDLGSISRITIDIKTGNAIIHNKNGEVLKTFTQFTEIMQYLNSLGALRVTNIPIVKKIHPSIDRELQS